MHPLLLRQLTRLGLGEERPPDGQDWQALLERVSRAYVEADQTRYLLERALETSTGELQQIHADAKQASDAERIRERHKLRSLNWFLDSIIENIPAMIVVKDATTLEFVRVNRAAEELLGIGREELLGRGDHDFFPKEEADRLIAQDRRVLTSGALLTIDEDSLLSRSLGRRSLATTKIPITDERDVPIFVLAISRDTTVEKENQARLEQAKENERVSRAKSAFLANMTHELRTPLNAIIGFSEMLEDQVPGPLNEKQSRYVGTVLTSSRHLLRLIGEVLDLSKLEAGRMRLHRTTVDFGEALRRVGGTIQPLAAKKSIDLVVVAEREPPPLAVADEQRIDQILYNLLANAVKFTGESGRIEARVTRSSETIEVAVQDNGIGIAAQDLERIFQEFEQVDSSYTRAQQGTGLGLALTKRLVELHHGRIRVESQPGQGSTFSFVIPLSFGESADADAPEPEVPDARTDTPLG